MQLSRIWSFLGTSTYVCGWKSVFVYWGVIHVDRNTYRALSQRNVNDLAGFKLGTGFPSANAGDTTDKGSIPGWGRSPGGGHGSPLQSSWRIPRTEEPGGLQSMGSPRVGHDWATCRSCKSGTGCAPLRRWRRISLMLQGLQCNSRRRSGILRVGCEFGAYLSQSSLSDSGLSRVRVGLAEFWSLLLGPCKPGRTFVPNACPVCVCVSGRGEDSASTVTFPLWGWIAISEGHERWAWCLEERLYVVPGEGLLASMWETPRPAPVGSWWAWTWPCLHPEQPFPTDQRLPGSLLGLLGNVEWRNWGLAGVPSVLFR